MYGEFFRVSPYLHLIAQRHKAKMDKRYGWLKKPMDVQDALRRYRKSLLGSGLSLEMFVRENKQPVEKNVIALARYLGKCTASFLQNGEHLEDLCTDFFYFCLQLYAYGMIGDDSVDDLIQLAEVYEKNPTVLSILGYDDLPEELAEDFDAFLMENNQAPPAFSLAVTGAVSKFLGVLKENER